MIGKTKLHRITDLTDLEVRFENFIVFHVRINPQTIDKASGR